MKRLTDNKIIIVVRKTRLDDLISRYNTPAQVKFHIEHLGSDFGDYLQEHDRYKKAVVMAETTLQQLGQVQVVDRQFLANFIFGKDDIIVVLGQDGLVANTLKYLEDQVVIGVNPEPSRWDGVLLPFEVRDLDKVVRDVFEGSRKITTVTMARAELTDGQQLYAVNDLFIGARSHVSARYSISIGGQSENQSSSGIIISTGMGSTGWLKSVLAGAEGIAGALSKREPAFGKRGQFAWNARYLCFSVREPFPSNTTGTSVVFGKITGSKPMEVESCMSGNGVIFSDGIESDFMEFNSGMKATIGVANKCGHLIV